MKILNFIKSSISRSKVGSWIISIKNKFVNKFQHWCFSDAESALTLAEKPNSIVIDSMTLASIAEAAKKISDYGPSININIIDASITKVVHDPIIECILNEKKYEFVNSGTDRSSVLRFVKVSQQKISPEKYTEFIVDIITTFDGIDGCVWRIDNKIRISAFTNNTMYDEDIVNIALAASNGIIRQRKYEVLARGSGLMTNIDTLITSQVRNTTGYIKTFGVDYTPYNINDMMYGTVFKNENNILFDSIGITDMNSLMKERYMEMRKFLSSYGTESD